MELYIGEAAERMLSAHTFSQGSDGGLFQSELNSAVGKRSENLLDYSSDFSGECYRNNCYFGADSDPLVLISRKIEEKMKNDPDYSDEISRKLNELLQNQGKCLKDRIVIVGRDGEISQYSTRSKKDDLRTPSAEELKEVAKARARRKARLDAYFHLLERVAIKRKLIEQENAKRLINKKYRRSVSNLDIEARARQITDPPKNPDYFF